MWTGFYVGLNAGGTWANNNSVTTTAFPGPAAATFESEAATSALLASGARSSGSNGGFIGGGQIGYNWQFGGGSFGGFGGNAFVAGIEADIQGIAGSTGSASSFAAGGVPLFPTETMTSSVSVSKQLSYFGTVRGRLGYLITPTLLAYGTGGLAYGGVQSNTSIFQNDCCIFPGGVSAAAIGAGAFSDTRVGWTVGGGVEWMFMPNWSAKVEYLYYDLGNVSYAVSPLIANAPGFAVPTWTSFASTTMRFNGNIVRAGLNYHFNWGSAPVVARF